MRNVNDPLTLAYFTLLKTACDPVPVFRDGYVPKDLAQDAYVMISAIDNSDNSSMQSHDTITSIQVGIYTRSNTDNNADAMQDLSSLIYETIMPDPVNSLSIENFQVLTSELVSDTSPEPFDTGSQLFINRFLRFRHKVFHKPYSVLIPQADILYGFNGNMAASPIPFSDTDFLAALSQIPYNIQRWPGGAISNEFNWRTGKRDDNTGQANTLDDAKALVDAVGCDILFVLNMITKDLDDQLEMLATAESKGIPIKYIELGNELNNENNVGRITFPTAADYATASATWIAAIKNVYPDVLIACVGENKDYNDDVKTWNNQIISGANPDALTTHVYPNPAEFVTDGIADLARLQTLTYRAFVRSGMTEVRKPIWVTEYNYGFDAEITLTEQSQINTILKMTQVISQILEGYPGIKIMCAHNIVGNQGAFDTDNFPIAIKATGTGIKQFLT